MHIYSMLGILSNPFPGTIRRIGLLLEQQGAAANLLRKQKWTLKMVSKIDLT
jgi:hypothetical protein